MPRGFVVATNPRHRHSNRFYENKNKIKSISTRSDHRRPSVGLWVSHVTTIQMLSLIPWAHRLFAPSITYIRLLTVILDHDNRFVLIFQDIQQLHIWVSTTWLLYGVARLCVLLVCFLLSYICTWLKVSLLIFFMDPFDLVSWVLLHKLICKLFYVKFHQLKVQFSYLWVLL